MTYQVGELEHEYWGTPDYRYLQLRAQLEEMDRRAIERTHIMEAMDLARADGHKAGLKEGLKEGRMEALLATARQMESCGLPNEQIARFIGLSIDAASAL